MATLITRTDDKTGAITQRMHYPVSDLLEHAIQFCEALTVAPPQYTYEELREDFKAGEVLNHHERRLVVIFGDNSCAEFFENSPEIRAHGSHLLQQVLNKDSRLWPIPSKVMQ